MAVFGLFRAHLYTELRGRNAAAHGFLDLEPRAGIEAMQGLEKRFGRSAGVQQSADSHVAADAGECVEVANSHARLRAAAGAAAVDSDDSSWIHVFIDNHTEEREHHLFPRHISVVDRAVGVGIELVIGGVIEMRGNR